MILKGQREHQEFMLNCYDDANRLFEEPFRAQGTLDMMASLLEGCEVYCFHQKDTIVGWMAYENRGHYMFLSGMYVMRSHHGTGVADILLDFYHEQCRKSNQEYSVLKFLNNAPWAYKFYAKQGYAEKDLCDLPQTLEKVVTGLERPYATVHMKSILK